MFLGIETLSVFIQHDRMKMHNAGWQILCGCLAGVQALRMQKNKPFIMNSLLLLGSGSFLLSRAVSSQVPSAPKGLTSVFGMGTGGSPSSSPPEIFFYRTLTTAQRDSVLIY